LSKIIVDRDPWLFEKLSRDENWLFEAGDGSVYVVFDGLLDAGGSPLALRCGRIVSAEHFCTIQLRCMPIPIKIRFN